MELFGTEKCVPFFPNFQFKIVAFLLRHQTPTLSWLIGKKSEIFLELEAPVEPLSRLRKFGPNLYPEGFYIYVD